MKYFVYNFYGDIYETTEAFDETVRQKMREAKANGEPFSRQMIVGDKIINQYYHPAGIWLDEE
jgi:hypothetical protein